MKKSILLTLSLLITILLSACSPATPASTTNSAPTQSEISQTSTSSEIQCSDTKTAIAQRGAILIDVREPYEYTEAHLESAILIPLNTLSVESLQSHGIQKDDEIITQCRSGNRSMQAQKLLTNLGYTNVKSLSGGITICMAL